KVHNRAAAVECLIVGGFAKNTQEREKGIGRRDLALGRPQEAVAHPGHGVLEGLERQRGAALEVPVDSTLPQPGNAHDLGHRRAAIAAGVEETRRLGHDMSPSYLALLHVLSEKETDRSLGRETTRSTKASQVRAASTADRPAHSCRTEPQGRARSSLTRSHRSMWRRYSGRGCGFGRIGCGPACRPP